VTYHGVAVSVHPELDRNRTRLGASVTAQLADNANLHVGYTGEITGSDDRHSFGATFELRW
jgi:outer membrane autotransporter protein